MVGLITQLAGAAGSKDDRHRLNCGLQAQPEAPNISRPRNGRSRPVEYGSERYRLSLSTSAKRSATSTVKPRLLIGASDDRQPLGLVLGCQRHRKGIEPVS